MTLFFHEYIQKETATKKRTYERELKNIEFLKTKQHLYDIGYDLSAELFEHKIELMLFDYGMLNIDINVPKDSYIPSGINKIVDALEEIILPLGFKLDTNTSKDVGNQWYNFYYNKGDDKIKLEIYTGFSTHCKMVTTTVMKEVKEIKYVCDEEG